MPKNKLQIEIWSDVMCPFCYIGKRKFEKALAQFQHKDRVEITWKSFQLDPGLKTDPNTSIDQLLADKKGWTLEHAREMNEYVSELAKQVGLSYHFDKAIVANSFDAHRFSHLAKKHSLQNEAEERLFAAYFSEGKNTADHATLVELGKDIGLDAKETEHMLLGTMYADEVRADVSEAQQVSVSGVPFFVLDRKYAISGAQESDTFLQGLHKAWAEFEAGNQETTSSTHTGAICTPDGCKSAK
jgi:predicted DsbA family dithiol-disulfide isomerase